MDSMETLARQAAAGDTAALESLLAQIRPQVLRRCSRMLPCFEDAEEACQDALLQVATSIGRFEGRSLFSTWLYVVVGNSSRQTYRRLKQRSVETAHASLPVEPVDPRTTSVIAGSRLDFLEALEKLEARRPELVGALVLRDICQLDYSEIASFLGVPEGTVKSRIHQARADVRSFLS
jgi:RNA polymerase sigma-70 factor (ECF subfamily)